MKSIVTWFEIPALDFDRCRKFYECILDVKMHYSEMEGVKHAFFPHEGEAIGGAIVQEDYLKPGTEGPLVYLNGGENLDTVLNKVEGAGGKVLMPRRLISEHVGYMAQFLDTEGNRFALYEPIKHTDSKS
ncbi:MAG: VOC family protein [Chitinophagales bacterium]|nr:VOC family protein [Chitinophagales bacterium]